MRRIVILVLALLTARFATAGEPQYLVTFAESVDVNDELVQQVARTYGATIDDLRGKQLIMRMPDSRAQQLSSDARIRMIAALSTELIDWNTGVDYTYDGAGNVHQIGNDTFTYDTVGRLVQGQTAGITRAFNYDAFGNRTDCREGGVPCQTTSHAFSAFTNQSSAMQYDPAGNVRVSSSHVYDYDALHMQTRDRVGLTSREYIYTADDERIAVYNVGAWWNWTIRDPSGRVLRELTSEGASGTSNWKWTKDYIWRESSLLATLQPGATPGSTTTYHYHLDHLGTPRRITDASDRIVGHHDYHAFGPERPGGRDEPSLTVLKYTGHERDGSDPEALDYMHARYYSTSLGRFLSLDPVLDVKTALRRPQSWNRYAYVMNNPVRFTDPTGKYTCSGTAEQCKQVEAGIENVRKAAATALAEGQRGAARLLSVVAFYGKAGEKNGVNVVLGDRQDYGAAGTQTTSFLGLFNTTTIKVDSDYLSRMANGGAAGAVKLAETMAHEGGHGIFQRAFGMTTTRAAVKREEVSAYTTEAGVNEAFRVDNSHGIWTNRVGWRPASIEYWAEESTRAWAGEPPLVPQN